MPYRAVERRRMLAAAALGRDGEPPGLTAGDGVTLDVVIGEILDVSPHLIIVADDEGVERRLVIAPWATAWHGAPVSPVDLPVGARVIIRALRSGAVAERIWANITRITGIIRAVHGKRDLTIEVDSGPHRGQRSVVVPYRASGRIRVRHPQLEPGYLFDAIGVLDTDGMLHTGTGLDTGPGFDRGTGLHRGIGVHRGTVLAQLPPTSQPPYRASAVPPPPPAYRGTQSKISGTAVWGDFEEYGVAYPMLETADTGCDDAGASCTGLPYLALGSMLYVRNVCDGRANALPIVACGCMAGRFCDRCLECGTSPRGRVVELSAVSYVQLGGDLTKGCFNARVGLG